MDRISIIVPIGPGRDGRVALTSLLKAHFDFELIVVLDRAAPHPLVKEFANHIPVTVVQSPSSGACAARNFGFSQTKKPTLCWFLDDDDEVVPSAGEALKNAFDQAPTSGAWAFASISKSTGASSARRFQRSTIQHSHLLRQNVLGGCSSVIINASTFRAAGGFDPNFESMQDWDLYLHLAQHGSIHKSAEPIIIYDNLGTDRISADPAKKRSGLIRLLAKHQASFDHRTRAFHETRVLYYNCLLGRANWPSLLSAPHRSAGLYYSFLYLRGHRPMRQMDKQG